MIGIIVGFSLKKYDKFLHIIDWLTQFVIFALLFVLGYSIGQNKMIFNNLGTIGIESLIYALGTIFGSILLVKLIWKKVFSEK